jgi:beta-N-acetylhexosaminidase
MKELTIEQKVGQLMLIGWQSKDVDEMVELIRKYHFGNVILFTRNIGTKEELKQMCDKIQEASLLYNGVKAFIAIDQEGGSIRRIYDESFTDVPGHMAIGAASFHNKEAAYEIGSILGQELKSCGVNFDLAPVVDINTNPYNPVIANRAFSDDPETVKRLAKDFSRGLQKSGVLSCYKHFIGHGNVEVDSHLDLPHLNTSLEVLRKTELVPYMDSFISDSIMTAHILYKQIDDRFPASISSKIIKGLLRDELNYNGLVLTDCFEMDAISRAFSLSEASVFAINAGADMVMMSHSFGKQLTARNGILNAVKTKEIKMETIDKAVNRILSLKEKYTKESQVVVDLVKNQETAKKVSLESVTITHGKPFSINEQCVCIGVTNYLHSVAEDENVEKLDIAKLIGNHYGIEYLSIDNKNFNVNDIIAFAKNRKVVLCLADSHLTLVQRVLYSNLIANGNEVMLISLRTPYDLLGQSLPVCHICLYEYTKQSLDSLKQVLDGRKTVGKLPVKIKERQDDRQIYKHKSHLIRQALMYVEENYQREITLSILAEHLLISTVHLSRVFKKETGVNFISYLTNFRIEKAKSFLITSQLRVYEIANLCGFSDVNYFSKVFYKVVGINPIDYRNNYDYYD